MHALVRMMAVGLLALGAWEGPMAQLGVTPNPLSAGGTATITYSGGPPNGTITVDIDDGGSPPQTDSVQITLDANGDGSTTWAVPCWSAAKFNAPDCSEIGRIIVKPGGTG